MQSRPAGTVAPPRDEAPTMAQGAALWSALCDRLQLRARLDAEIVRLTGELQRSGTMEALEGLPLDAALNLVHRLPSADRSMQITAGDVLRDMPVTQQLFDNQTLSWGQVRGIVAEAKRMSREERALLDARIAASEDRLTKMDPDDLLDAVRAAALELRTLRSIERSEERAPESNFVWGQTTLFGRSTIYGELDTLSFAAVFAGMDALAPSDDGRTTAQRRADGLVALATHRCDADPVTGEITEDAGQQKRRTRHPALGRDAVPSVLAIVEVDEASAALGGSVQLPIAGTMPVLTSRIMDALANDANLQVVLMDNGAPLAVSRKIRAKQVPRDIATAIRARDRGDRFPGSRRAIEHLHHLDKDGQGHAVSALVGTAGISHRRIHRCGWRITIDGREVTFHRHERSWTTLPRGTRLRHAPPPEPAPPRPTGHGPAPPPDGPDP